MPFGYSAIGGLLSQMEEAKRRMQRPLAPPPDAFRLPQQGGPPAPPDSLLAPTAPSHGMPDASDPFASVANANISDPNDLSYQYRPGIRGRVLGLLGADRVAPELQALLTPDQMRRVKPGVVGTLWNAINYGVGPQTVMQARAENLLGLQDKKAAHEAAATLKAQIAALRKKGGNFRDFAAELAMLRPELASQLSAMVKALEPPTPASLQREDNVLGEDGKPYIVYSDPITGKEVRRVRQYVAPQTPRRQLAQVPQADGTVKFIWLTEGQDALGAKSSSAQQLPSVAIEKMIALDDAIAAAEDATNTMATAKTEKANVSGRVGGVLPVPGWVRNQAGQGGEVGRSARSKIGNLTSMIGNLRSGGAITPQEFERLETFLPTPNDDEAVIDGKLKDFTVFLKQMKKTREAAYQKYGKGAPAGAAKPPTQDQADWDAAVALHGKDKVLKEFGPRPEGD